MINEGDDLTLEKCMNLARTHELSKKQLKTMNTSEDPDVYAVKSKNHPKQRHSKKQNYGKTTAKSQNMMHML